MTNDITTLNILAGVNNDAPLLCLEKDAVLTFLICPSCGTVSKFRISQCNETKVSCRMCNTAYFVFAMQDGEIGKIVDPPPPRDTRNYGREQYHKWLEGHVKN